MAYRDLKLALYTAAAKRKLRKSLLQRGFELWPSASQSETLTTMLLIHCMYVDVKLGIYTATDEKS